VPLQAAALFSLISVMRIAVLQRHALLDGALARRIDGHVCRLSESRAGDERAEDRRGDGKVGKGIGSLGRQIKPDARAP